MLAYKTYVLPSIEYCSPVWSPSNVTDIVRIESVQRSFTKTLFTDQNALYHERLRKCGLITLEHRRLIADLIFIV